MLQDPAKKPRGLFGFYSLISKDEYWKQVAREDEKAVRQRDDETHKLEKANQLKAENLRERAKNRKRKSRLIKKTQEISIGLRSPGGSKKRIVIPQLSDSSSKKTRSSLSELSRPARALKQKFKNTQRKPQGRKKILPIRPAKYHNWHTPFAWAQIERAVKHAGWRMSASEIVGAARKIDPDIFGELRRTTVEAWIDRSGDKPRWKDSILHKIEQGKGNDPGHRNGGQRGVVDRHPEVVAAIKKHLLQLQVASAPLNVVTIRGVILATITAMKPEILEIPYRDGSTFKASDDFVRRWVKKQLNWSERKATRAAHKIPDDWEDKCEKSFLRKAFSIKEYDIPSSLYVNSDQTQVVFAPGDKMTYAPSGAKQVSLVGGDEKRAFTVMVSVANNGTLLPFQAIYEGKTSRSCPSKSAPNHDNVFKAGMRLEFSGTATYWSNQQMMKNFVDHILSPYFDHERALLGLPQSQMALWQIDVWSVHRSDEFRGWMRRQYDNIILDFVPGGCTGIHQPCDVGIQRPFKHSIKRSYHEAVVEEMLEQISEDLPVVGIDKRIGTLRDRSVGWWWNAFRAVGKPELVKKAFAMCEVRGWNLSYESLISFEARDRIRRLKTEDPLFWSELTQGDTDHELPSPAEVVEEDDEEVGGNDEYGDDSSLGVAVVTSAMLGGNLAAAITTRLEGGLVPRNDADSEHGDFAGESKDDGGNPQASSTQPSESAGTSEQGEIGRGKRKKFANKLYAMKTFIRHNDDDGSDVD